MGMAQVLVELSSDRGLKPQLCSSRQDAMPAAAVGGRGGPPKLIFSAGKPLHHCGKAILGVLGAGKQYWE
jgi:hypothetical protein